MSYDEEGQKSDAVVTVALISSTTPLDALDADIIESQITNAIFHYAIVVTWSKTNKLPEC